MTSRRRAPILTAAVLALACAVPGAASGASPFRQVVAYSEGEITSDGERYATVGYGEPIFDTLRGRRFRPAPPVPDCRYGGFGGGLVVWDCAPPRQTLITNLATGRSREPAGIQRVYARTSPITYCTTGGVGRYWLEFSCGAGMGPRSEEYLNHRTGEIVDLSWVIRNNHVVDLNYEGLVRDVCPSVMERGVSVSSEPFGLGFDGSATPGLTLRACGRDRVETISRCLSVCVSPQLGSRYVTWGEEDVVFAYLPRIRRRVAIGRAPGLNAYSTVRSIAHTCNRVFAQWAYTIYVARFEPRRGAPPCQSRR